MTWGNISFRQEPALWVAAVNAVLIMAISFGAPISAEQKTAVDGVLAALLAIAGGITVRAHVTPNIRILAKPVASSDDVPTSS